MLKNKNLRGFIEVDSAGTSSYHLGSAPDPRAIAAAARRGYSLHAQVARQVSVNDFLSFDYVLAMDEDNLRQLQAIAPAHSRARIRLLLDYSSEMLVSVPDPYFGGGEAGFETAVDLVEGACERFLQHLEHELAATKMES